MLLLVCLCLVCLHLLLPLLLQSSPHRVEVAVLCWPITLDRTENYWTVLYCLQVRVGVGVSGVCD